jgi:hypothetical protein
VDRVISSNTFALLLTFDFAMAGCDWLESWLVFSRKASAAAEPGGAAVVGRGDFLDGGLTDSVRSTALCSASLILGQRPG